MILFTAYFFLKANEKICILWIRNQIDEMPYQYEGEFIVGVNRRHLKLETFCCLS